MTLLRKAQHT